MKKSFITLFVLLIFVNFSYAIELGISPPKIEFRGETNEKICNSVTLYVKDFKGYLVGEDRWKEGENSRDVNQYNLKSDDMNIKMDYNDKIEIKKTDTKKKINICITAEDEGVYYGVLLFNAENSFAGVGGWVVLNIKEGKEIVNEFNEKSEIEDKPSSLESVTGSVTGVYNNKQSTITLFLLVLVTIIVVIWLIMKKEI